MDVSSAIAARIDEAGPISFVEFMEIALYGPGGFYEEPPVGEAGHFVTGPHVHPVFGRLVARAIDELWDATGEAGPPRIVEAGAGEGTLAAQLLEALPAAEYTAVERSPVARTRLAELGIGVATDITEIAGGRATVIVANELLDNLPFHRVRATRDGLVEVRVAFEEGRFVEVDARCPAEVAAEVAAAAPPLKPGEEAAVSLEALRFTDGIVRVIGRGYALLIDYERAPGEPAGGVHGYRQHRVVEDFLAEPGTADITAGVDFASLARRAAAAGLRVFGPVTQRSALLALGFEDWGRDERERQGKLLDRGSGVGAVRAWSERNAAALLVNRDGLGALRWMVLATAGLPRPSWCQTT